MGNKARNRFSFFDLFPLALFISITIPLYAIENGGAAPNTSTLANDSPISMANLEGEPSAFIHQCVNVITGQFCNSQIDLIAYHGVEPLTVERSYFGTSAQKGKLGLGWTVNHSSQLTNQYYPEKNQSIIERCITVEEDNGCRFEFPKIPISKIYPYPISMDCLKKGVTNTSTGRLSGQTNLKNLKMDVSNNDVYRMASGAGSIKEFSRNNKSKIEGLLLREIKPSGNIVDYTYHELMPGSQPSAGSMPVAVNVYNRANKKTNSLNFQHFNPNLIGKHHPTHEIRTLDNRWVRYHFGKYKRGYLLDCVERSDGPKESYSYYYFDKDVGGLQTVKRKTLPEGRYIEADYYNVGLDKIAGKSIDIANADDPRMYRVNKLIAPAGVDTTPVTIYQFIYHINQGSKKKHEPRELLNGYCDVYDALGLHTQYGFNEDQRLLWIDKFNKNGSRYTRELLYWGQNDSKDATQLLARTLEQQDGLLTFARTYRYDQAGNVLQDALYGNLSGHNKISPAMTGKGVAKENGCECYCKRCSYSNDGLNLLLRESDGFQTIDYRYAQGSNRVIAKFKGTDVGSWLQRWFYAYNEDGAITQEIVDDGTSEEKDNLSGVTERYITNYTQSQVYPVAYPIVIEEKCLDVSTGKEILIRKVVNTYNNLAKIEKQDHYDSENIYSHSLIWKYDNMGNLFKEVDALGRVTTRRFDGNGNCIFEQGPNPDLCKNFTYDYMNRLICQEEVHSDGVTLSTKHRYDLVGNRLSTVDQYGNETTFNHDEFGRIIKIQYPKVLDENGKNISPKISKHYDVMGNVTKEVDAKRNEVKKTYTLRGQVVSTTYADGTTEQNTYQLNGFLIQSKARNNAVTKYTNDIYGRPVQTEIYSASGELLSTTKATYNAFHILTETDAMGVVTQYAYYPNGKLKSRQKGDSLATYNYDALGKLSTTTEWYGYDDREVIVKIQKFDLLDRLLEERVEDESGEILTQLSYEYDHSGNLKKLTSIHKEGVEATTETNYDSRGVPILVIDAQGHHTMTKCRYDFINALNQYVPYQEVIDALGNVTVIEKDALGRVLIKQRKNAFGKIIQKQENRYDANGNHCLICDTIFRNTDKPKPIHTKMEYDSFNRLVACYEALNRPEQKQCKITYNNFGQKKELIKNDGIILTHTYDGLGRLESLSSSDHTIHYKYHYDSNSNPILVEDLIQQTSTIKKYDTQNRLKEEVQANGLCVAYQYDRLGRPTQMTLPDKSSVAYDYRANLLKNVSRLDALGNSLYEYRYDNYDKAAHLTGAILPGHAGTINYQYDLLGRVINIKAPHWEENISHYDGAGNLVQMCLCDTIGDVISSYGYDDLYQLTSEEGISKHAYTYDSHYNRMSKDGRTHTYNALHQLINDGINQYDYDRNGNMISKISHATNFKYTYDALDRLIEVINGTQKVCYTYDDNNRRLSKTSHTLEYDVWKIDDKKNQRYLYQGQNEIGACDQNDRITELRILGNNKGAEMGAAVAIEIGNSTYVPIHDHNGNVVCLLDFTGAPIETYRYTAYGEELFDSSVIPWRFASKRVDDESGFVYFGRRYYDPSTGRWVTPDPIGREGGPNLFAYVLNSPLSHYDSYGLFAESSGAAFGEVLGSLLEKVFEFCGSILSLAGKAIECTAHHFIPIPYVKDLFEFGGWCIGGKDPGKFVPSWENKSEMILHEGYGDVDPHRMYVTYNGICCSREDCEKRAAYLSKLYGGVNVYSMYNASNGFLLDILEVVCQKVGVPTNVQASAEYETARLAKQMGPGGIFFVDAHSQGCETVNNLSYGLRKMMHVSGFGPARILQDHHFASAHNYVSAFDYVSPLADPWGLVKGCLNGSVSFVSPRGCPFLNHSLEGPTYRGIISAIGADFRKTWGSVE